MRFPLFLLPPIGYLLEIAKLELIRFEVHETFPKQTFRNRFEIVSSQGMQRLVVPLEKRKSKDKTHEIKISYRENWPYYFEKALTSNYRNSPYFDYFAPSIFEQFQKKHTYLIDLNLALFELMLSYFQLPTKYEQTESFRPLQEQEQFNLKSDFKAVSIPPYYQLFEEKNGFLANLSCLDLLLMKGPEAPLYFNVGKAQ